jgi:molybdopterin-guanine dinucleotide biosynthesis protein A
MPTAAVLTGGSARRFDGRDKSALVVGGRSILERQLDVLSQLSDDILIVAHPATRDPIAGPIKRHGARVVHDRLPGYGPLAGLDAALATARHDVIILIACDMPFVTAALLDYLAAASTGADAAVPLTEQGYHPLCAAYARTCHNTVERRLAERRLAMRGLLEDLRVRSVTERELATFGDPSRLLSNVNTAAEYTKLVQQERECVA